MEDFVVRTYINELIHQGEAAHIAVQDFNTSLNNQDGPRTFAAVQSLLAASAMVSKLLWPHPPNILPNDSPIEPDQEEHRQFTLARGRTLRKALKIKGIPVLESRKVRNALEHFDDRLDRYFREGHRMVIDRNIGPREQMIIVDGQIPTHLRLIDNEKCTISVLDDEVSIQQLFDAMMDVMRRANEWLSSTKQ